MKFLAQTIGWIFVLLGVVGPAVGGYLYSTRADVLEVYYDTHKDFGSLPEEQREQLVQNLDDLIVSWAKAKEHAAHHGLVGTFPPVNQEAR